MSCSGNKTVKLFVVAAAVSLLLLGSFGVNQAVGEDKKPTVTLVWEKQMDMEYSFLKQYEYDQLAGNYFKAQERILLGQVGEQENVITTVPFQEIRFVDRQGKIVKKIPLQWTENVNLETGIGKREVAFLSTDGKYVGISRFSASDTSFELLDSAGNSLWRKELEDGLFSKAFITQGANNVVLFITNNGDSDTPPDTLQFFSKDGTLLKEYTKPGFEINRKEIGMDKQENINVILERGRTYIFSHLNAQGELIWERDITGFLPSVYISGSGEYYLLRKVEGNERYDYLFNKEGNLLQKNLASGASWLSPDGDFRGTETGDQIQYTSISSKTPLFNIDSRRLPGEEKTNTTPTAISIHTSGQYLLISLIKQKDKAPGWIVILNNDNKKVYQITFPRGNLEARFSEDGKFIRTYNYGENKIMLYKFEYQSLINSVGSRNNYS